MCPRCDKHVLNRHRPRSQRAVDKAVHDDTGNSTHVLEEGVCFQAREGLLETHLAPQLVRKDRERGDPALQQEVPLLAYGVVYIAEHPEVEFSLDAALS